jgi:S-DNA-T family DNA segregation ATPase FtsK/SpoIIIE
MARKEPAIAAQHRGFGDILGIVLIAGALLLLLAQVSFVPSDLASNKVPANQTTHNWIGGVGAWGANLLFQVFGAGAFVLPILLLLYGLGCLFELFAYLKRRWPWAAVLFVTCLGFFDLYSASLETLRRNLNAPSAGGHLGQILNDLLFRNLGKPGATIIFCTLYIISLIGLTNFQLMPWLRARLASRKAATADEVIDDKSLSPEERALAKRARELEKQAKKLQDELDRSREKEKAREDKSGLGPDLRPVPAPTVRDLSVPAPRIGKAVRPKVEEPAIARGELEGEVISATEIAAASTADILGPNAELTKKVEKSSRGEKTEKTGPGPVEDWGPDRLTRKPEAEQPAERSDAVPAAASASTSAAGAPSAAPGLEPKFTDNSGAARRPSLK